MKPGVPFLIGDESEDVCAIMQEIAPRVPTSLFKAKSVPVNYLQNEKGEDQIERQLFRIGDDTIQTPLLGEYQRENMRTAWCAVNLLRLLGFSISGEAMQHGFANVIEQTHLLGRWQTLSLSPRIICDTGHNVAGISQVTKQISTMQYKQLRIVFGMVGDKDVSAVLSLLPQDAIYYFTKAQGKRALSEIKLSELAAQYNLKGKCYESVIQAYNAAKQDASEEDLIYIGGSTYVVAEII